MPGAEINLIILAKIKERRSLLAGKSANCQASCGFNATGSWQLSQKTILTNRHRIKFHFPQITQISQIFFQRFQHKNLRYLRNLREKRLSGQLLVNALLVRRALPARQQAIDSFYSLPASTAILI